MCYQSRAVCGDAIWLIIDSDCAPGLSPSCLKRCVLICYCGYCSGTSKPAVEVCHDALRDLGDVETCLGTLANTCLDADIIGMIIQKSWFHFRCKLQIKLCTATVINASLILLTSCNTYLSSCELFTIVGRSSGRRGECKIDKQDKLKVKSMSTILV